jgi:hypothetical protein
LVCGSGDVVVSVATAIVLVSSAAQPTAEIMNQPRVMQKPSKN